VKSRQYFAYAALLLLLAISLTYRVRQIVDRTDRLMHGDERVQPPFNIDSSGTSIVSVRPEAGSAGLRAGDTLLAVNGRAYRGAAGLYVPLREARAGDRLNIDVRSSDGSSKNAPVKLRSLRSGAPLTANEALQEVLAAVMPLFCVLLGFWVAAVRPHDPLAWIFFAMMSSFGETIAGGLSISRFGHDDFFQPIGGAYEQFAASIWSVSMMLFGIYFPERVEFDRRRPWLKWLLASAILLRAVQNGVAGALAGKDLATANRVRGFLQGDLALLMANVNRLLYEGSTSNRYATFFYAEYNAISRCLTYVNAGHNPPLVFRRNHPVMRLETGGPVVGLLPSFPYTQASVELRPGDVLVAFTDGISEAMNASDQEWGEDQLIECVMGVKDSDARETIAQILASADEFAAGAKQHDDMTLIVLRVGNSGTDV
jgi:hypothetical protein